MDGGMSERMLGEALERTKCFGEEFVSETCALPLVPHRGCCQIPIRLFPESDGTES